MYRKLFLIHMIIMLLCSCDPGTRSGGISDDLTVHGSPWEMATETYTGTVRGTEVIFQHVNYDTYRLSVANEVVEGLMKTEKGFEDDDDATLYILNNDRPEAEQAYFVRYSNGDLLMLDPQRKPLKKAKFIKQ